MDDDGESDISDIREFRLVDENPQIEESAAGVINNSGLEDLQPSRPEKRIRSEGTECDEEGFIRVEKKKLKSITGKNNNTKEEVYPEVCMTALNILPKQIKLAKLLNAENINKILRIKYRNPYKVFIKFETKKDAEKLLNCRKMVNLGFRCQLTDEMNLSYGIIRNIDLDVEEKEMLESLQCEYDIVSIRRLNRITPDNTWTASETVRICVKGNCLPLYVTGFGCRFKVDPYTFPVTQCSNCWSFGHMARFCPMRNALCPKCSKKHANCDTEPKEFKCLNCGGNHMALDKICSMFLKEKEIRNIMSKENLTYKNALLRYRDKLHLSLQENASSKQHTSYEINVLPTTTSKKYVVAGKSYRDATLRVEKTSGSDSGSTSGTSVFVNRASNGRIVKKTNKISNRKRKSNKKQAIKIVKGTELQRDKNSDQKLDQYEEKTKKKIWSWWRQFQEAKKFILSDKSFEEKVQGCFKYLYECIVSFVCNFAAGNTPLNDILRIIIDGLSK